MKRSELQNGNVGLGLAVFFLLLNSSSVSAVQILTDVECGRIFEKVEWIKADAHARLTLKSGIPNHWWLFSLRGVHDATIALKYPCPPSYVEARTQQLLRSGLPGQVGVYEAGRTVQGRPLRLFTIPAITSQTTARWKEKPTFLLYGGEHATEHESAGVVMGALDWLAGNAPDAVQFRSAYNVLLAPHLAPDDAADSVFNRITDGFAGSTYGYGRENVLWANFWTSYIERGYRLDVAIGFHNVAGAESPNFFSPVTQVSESENRCFAKALHEVVIQRMTAAKLDVKSQMGKEGAWRSRLFAWQEECFGGAGEVYEVNSQWPKNRLSLTQLYRIGADALRACGGFVSQPKLFAEQRAWQQQRMAAREKRKREIMAKHSIDPNNVPEWLTFNDLW